MTLLGCLHAVAHNCYMRMQCAMLVITAWMMQVNVMSNREYIHVDLTPTWIEQSQHVTGRTVTVTHTEDWKLSVCHDPKTCYCADLQ